MPTIRVHDWETVFAAPGLCWALWREDLPCPNRATWRVENTTNAGYTELCDVHKDGFARDYPSALVRYVSMPA